MSLLIWLGQRAQWVLLAGVIMALFLPGISAFMRPALPLLVSGVIGVAIARLDIKLIIDELNSPKKIAQYIGIVLLLMPAMACLFWLITFALGATHYIFFLLLVFAASPSIASTANLCFLLGFDAAKALVITLFGMILTPLLGPLIFWMLWPEQLDLEPITLFWRLFQIIAGGFAIGFLAKAIFGQAMLAKHKQAVDGFASVNMVLFLLPLFDGVLAEIIARPAHAFGIFIFACVLNLGSNLVMLFGLRAKLGVAVSGALGLAQGNRTVAIYLAVLPFDPTLSLFVALYQFPMYATPILFKMLSTVRQNQ
jgi:hypothetical protein